MKDKKSWYKKWWVILLLWPILLLAWVSRLIWQQKWNKKYRIAALIVLWGFIFLVYGGIVSKDNKPEARNQVSLHTQESANTIPIQAQSATPEPTKPSFTEQIWIALDKSMKTRDGYKIEYDTDSKTATIISSVDTAWDENALVRGSYIALVKYGREVFKVNNVDAVRVVVRTKFNDQYGKEVWGDAVRIIMSKEQFNKFDWGNLSYRPVSEQIQGAADGYWVDPVVDIKTTPDKLYLSL